VREYIRKVIADSNTANISPSICW